MKPFQRGQIWVVDFDPSVGHEYQKTRPALIIQQDKYVNATSLLTVIPTSSQTDKLTELDIVLKKDSQNRLMKDSLLKIKQISSFDKRRFVKFVGITDLQTMATVDENIQLFLFGRPLSQDM